ncbi:carbon storage regulator CsrA [Paenibacillus sp. FSL H8-0457]|uniref:carbon storage regulator CsrA n=1 Tax=unclassified Paenibacillus TaxID=185978 RepID=UPI00017890E9|nr:MULTISPECIES: carbon storage regulator CsrA [unclassified Paenibacillus]ACX68074.1 carbon storage regulator, CsrA [Paenibacillus sp. Y412MC10]ETT67825.1 carbon storage regulator CsrA [Paenibacillus sp. FSL H8-457]
MLVLSRKRGQTILINNEIEIFVSSIDGESVKLGISAPAEVSILRKELAEEVQATNLEASATVKNVNLLKTIKKQ